MADELKDLPIQIKWTLTIIERVGFPIAAFVALFVVCFYSLDRLNISFREHTAMVQKVMTDNTAALNHVVQANNEFRNMVKIDHDAMRECLSRMEGVRRGNWN